MILINILCRDGSESLLFLPDTTPLRDVTALMALSVESFEILSYTP
jgi:hypothetical protein